MAKRKDEDEPTGPVPPMPGAPTSDARVEKGWGAAQQVHLFVCVGCNEEKRGQKMLDGRCEKCWPKAGV